MTLLSKRPFIIADVGSNFRNSLEIAYAQIEAAKAAGCDAVKFQLFDFQSLYGLPGKLDYELSREWVPLLKSCADRNGIAFLCSAFSPEAVAFVDPYVEIHKLASSEMLHIEMIEAIRATGKPWIVSTGGAARAEVLELLYKYRPTAVLECVAQYPAKPEVYDLEVLQDWISKDWGQWRYVGVSDHTLGNEVALASIGFGGTIFEKHFDCDPGLISAIGDFDETPDSPVSIASDAMKSYVQSIHTAFSAIGDGIKAPRHQPEMALRWRRRLIATKDLEPGDTLRRGENFGIYRSLKDDTRAASPMLIDKFDGHTLSTSVKAGDGLWLTDLVE